MSASEDAKVELVNRALVKIGQPPAFSIGAQDQLEGIVAAVWPGIEAMVAVIYDWSFFRKTAKAQKLADTPENGWQMGFMLPADRIGEPLAMLRDPTREIYLREFMIEAGNVYANVEPVYVRYRAAADPAIWDLGFREAFATALAGALAVPLLQDEDLGMAKHIEAFGRPQENYGGGLFGRLIALNRASQPQGRRFLDDDPLTAARFRM